MNIKLKRGQKLCKSCNNINGARSRICKHCNKEFEVRTDYKAKVARKKKKRLTSNINWQTLPKGQEIYINGRSGNYFLNEDGTKTYSTHKGVYRVVEVKDEGLFCYGRSGNTFIYMGTEKRSQWLNTMYLSPHTIYVKKDSKIAQDT